MGAWGLGPFDSDGGLDFLGDLAYTHAERDDEDNIVAGTVNVDAVVREVSERLASASATTPTWECSDVYAAAGLVAAALRPDLATRSTRGGTRLFAAIAGEETTNLGLSSHCGYAALLDPAAAAGLREAAHAAVLALRGHTAWLEEWNAPLEGVLDDLATVLASPAPARVP